MSKNLTILFTAICIFTATQADAAPETILIKAKEVSVTRADYDLELLNIPEEHRLGFQLDKGRVLRLLEKILVNKILAHQARATQFDKQPEVVSQLEYSNNTKLGGLYLAQQRNAIKPPDLELRAREMFEKSREKYAIPEQVRASHLLVSARIRPRAEAEAKAKKLRSQVVAGEDFGKLVEAHTDDDGSRSKQGDLGFFSADQMVPQFSKAAFALTQPGQVSELVESDFGFHIIKLAEKKPKVPATFETHRRELLQQAESEYREATLRATLERMVNAQEPKPDQTAIEDLRPKIDFDALLKQAQPAPTGAKPADPK